MPTTVHVHHYRGLAQLPKFVSRQFSSDSVVALLEPPISGGANSISTSQTTTTAAPANTQIARIQVADGGKVRYAVINEASSAVADSDSPAITGEAIILFNAGWQLSLIEA